ncbi:MAG: hypothetical protein ACPG6N_08200, partial [Flavobacteriales bacterium]
LLIRLAESSQGAFLGALNAPSDLPQLRAAWEDFSASISAQDVVHMSSERLPLHAQLWLLVALLTLLTAEWALRRAGGGR